MLEGDITALITGLLTIIPGTAVALSRWLPGRLRVLGAAVVLLGCGKFFRLRGLFDVHVEPALSRLSHSHNLPVIMAVVAGLVSYALVIATLLRSRRSRRILAAFTTAVCLVLAVLHQNAYGDRFRPLLSADGLHNADQTVVWTLALFFQGLTSAVVLTLAIRAPSAGSFSIADRVTRLSLIAMGAGGLVYFASKAAFLFITTDTREGRLGSALQTASYISLSISAIGLGLAVYIPATLALTSRIGRFRELRRARMHKPLTLLWKLSSSPKSTHRAIVDYGDQLILRGAQSTAT